MIPKNINISLILKRLWKRIKHMLRFKEILLWESQTCDRCGCLQTVAWYTFDSLWYDVIGKESGLLCLDCFLNIAKSKNININFKEDITIYNK